MLEALFIEAIGHRECPAVVGDRDVLMAKTMRRRCHRLEVVLTVRGGGVHVQIAAQIADSDEHRQRASDGRLDFPRCSRSSGSTQAMPNA